MIWERLAGAGLRRESSAFFTWLGVVPYLTRKAIERTLEYVAPVREAEVVFDYTEAPGTFSGRRGRWVRAAAISGLRVTRKQGIQIVPDAVADTVT